MKESHWKLSFQSLKRQRHCVGKNMCVQKISQKRRVGSVSWIRRYVGRNAVLPVVVLLWVVNRAASPPLTPIVISHVWFSHRRPGGVIRAITHKLFWRSNISSHCWLTTHSSAVRSLIWPDLEDNRVGTVSDMFSEVAYMYSVRYNSGYRKTEGIRTILVVMKICTNFLELSVILSNWIRDKSFGSLAIFLWDSEI